MWILAVFAVVWIGYFAWSQKQLFIRAIPRDIKHRPTDVRGCDAVDQQLLDRLTTELEELGFAVLADLETTGQTVMPIVGFDRVLIHSEAGCIAVLSQLLQPAIPGGYSICSVFSNGLSYSTVDHATTAPGWAHRNPKHLWSAHPGVSSSELLRAHLERRDRLIDQFGLRVDPLMTVEAYTSSVEQKMRDVGQSMSAKWCVSVLADLVVYRLWPQREWMGEAPTESSSKN
jgi:hypothetical protein